MKLTTNPVNSALLNVKFVDITKKTSGVQILLPYNSSTYAYFVVIQDGELLGKYGIVPKHTGRKLENFDSNIRIVDIRDIVAFIELDDDDIVSEYVEAPLIPSSTDGEWRNMLGGSDAKSTLYR